MGAPTGEMLVPEEHNGEALSRFLGVFADYQSPSGSKFLGKKFWFINQYARIDR